MYHLSSHQNQKLFELQVFVNAISVIKLEIARRGPEFTIAAPEFISLLFPPDGELTRLYPGMQNQACDFLIKSRVVARSVVGGAPMFTVVINVYFVMDYWTILSEGLQLDGTKTKLTSLHHRLNNAAAVEAAVKWLDTSLGILCRDIGADNQTWIRPSSLFTACYGPAPKNGLQHLTSTGAIKFPELRVETAPPPPSFMKQEQQLPPSTLITTPPPKKDQHQEETVKKVEQQKPASTTTTTTTTTTTATPANDPEFETYKETTRQRLEFWSLVRSHMPRHSGGSILKSNLFQYLQDTAPKWNRSHPFREKFFEELVSGGPIPSCGFTPNTHGSVLILSNLGNPTISVQLRGIKVAPKKQAAAPSSPPAVASGDAAVASATPTPAPTSTPLTYEDMTLHLHELLAVLPLEEQVAKKILLNQFGWANEGGKFQGMFEAHISKGANPSFVRFTSGKQTMIALASTRNRMLNAEEAFRKQSAAKKSADQKTKESSETTTATTKNQQENAAKGAVATLSIPAPKQQEQQQQQQQQQQEQEQKLLQSARWKPDIEFYIFFDTIRSRLHCAPSDSWTNKSIIGDYVCHYSCPSKLLFGDRVTRTRAMNHLTSEKSVEFLNQVICAASVKKSDTMFQLNDPLSPAQREQVSRLDNRSDEKRESDLRQVFAHSPLRKSTAIEILKKERGWSEAAANSAFNRYHNQMPQSNATFHLLNLFIPKILLTEVISSCYSDADPFIALVDEQHKFYLDFAVETGLKRRLVEILNENKAVSEKRESSIPPQHISAPAPASKQQLLQQQQQESSSVPLLVPAPASKTTDEKQQHQLRRPAEETLAPAVPRSSALNSNGNYDDDDDDDDESEKEEQDSNKKSQQLQKQEQEFDAADEMLVDDDVVEVPIQQQQQNYQQPPTQVIMMQTHENNNNESVEQEEIVFSRSRVTVLDRPQLSKVAMMIRLERNRQEQEIRRCANAEQELKAAVVKREQLKQKIEEMKKQLEKKQKECDRLEGRKNSKEENIQNSRTRLDDQLSAQIKQETNKNNLFTANSAFSQHFPYLFNEAVFREENLSLKNDQHAKASNEDSPTIVIPFSSSQQQQKTKQREHSIVCHLKDLLKVGGIFFDAGYPSLVNPVNNSVTASINQILIRRPSSILGEVKLFECNRINNYILAHQEISSEDESSSSPSNHNNIMKLAALNPPNSVELKNYHLHVSMVLSKLYLFNNNNIRHHNPESSSSTSFIHCFKIRNDDENSDENETNNIFTPNFEYATLVARRSNLSDDGGCGNGSFTISWYVAAFDRPCLYFDESITSSSSCSRMNSILRDYLDDDENDNNNFDATFVGVKLSRNARQTKILLNPIVASSREDLSYLAFNVKNPSKQLFKIGELKCSTTTTSSTTGKTFIVIEKKK